MYRNYFYREDLKVELTQLEEEDEKERFLEGSKHKRLIPGYVALEVKENTCKISPVLYPEFRGKGYWKDARELCLLCAVVNILHIGDHQIPALPDVFWSLQILPDLHPWRTYDLLPEGTASSPLYDRHNLKSHQNQPVPV